MADGDENNDVNDEPFLKWPIRGRNCSNLKIIGPQGDAHPEYVEWRYPMRYSMQEVSPGVFLGPYSLVQKSKLQFLKDQGITHIVCVRQDIEARFIRPNFPDEFQYLVLNIANNPDENIKQHFESVGNFIDEALSRGGRVLIHGNTGHSRSATLAVAYVMRRNGMSFDDAICEVSDRRYCICPNPGFLEQLEQYETELSESRLESTAQKRIRLANTE